MAIDLNHSVTGHPGIDRTPLDWTRYPASGSHYTKIDEGMASKNTSDYVLSAVDGNEDEYGLFSGGTSLLLQELNEIWIDLYMQGTVYTETPGIRITVYDGASIICQGAWNANTGGAWQVRRHKFTGLSESDVFAIGNYDY